MVRVSCAVAALASVLALLLPSSQARMPSHGPLIRTTEYEPSGVHGTQTEHTREDPTFSSHGHPARSLKHAGHSDEHADSAARPSCATAVTTAEGLKNAIKSGAEHILIEDHLDFTSYREDVQEFPAALGILIVPPTVKSITGDCPAFVPRHMTLKGAPIIAPKHNQCMLVSSEGTFLEIVSAKGNMLWLDNLLLRSEGLEIDRDLVAIRRVDKFAALWSTPSVYITRSTFQGNGLHAITGLYSSGRVYVEECTFSHLGFKANGHKVSAMVEFGDSTAVFARCEFINNNAPNSVVLAKTEGYSGVKLQQCIFQDNDVLHSLGTDSFGVFYSDMWRNVWVRDRNDTMAASGLREAAASRFEFLSDQDKEFLDLKSESGLKLDTCRQSSKQIHFPFSKGKAGKGAFGGVAVFCMLLVAAAGLFVAYKRYQGSRSFQDTWRDMAEQGPLVMDTESSGEYVELGGSAAHVGGAAARTDGYPATTAARTASTPPRAPTHAPPARSREPDTLPLLSAQAPAAPRDGQEDD